jgi:hypothetical protein
MPSEPLTEADVEKLRNHANQVGSGYDTGNLMRRYSQDITRLLDDRRRMTDRLNALEAAVKVHQTFRDDLWRAIFPNMVQPGDGRECADVVEGVKRLVQIAKALAAHDTIQARANGVAIAEAYAELDERMD